MKKTFTLFMLLALSSLIFFPEINFAQTTVEKNLIECIKKSTRKIERNPAVSSFYAQRSLCIVQLNAASPEQDFVNFSIEDAFSDINKAIQLDSANAELYGIRAGLKRDFKFDHVGAINDLKMAMQIEPYQQRWFDEAAAYQKLMLNKSYIETTSEQAPVYKIVFE